MTEAIDGPVSVQSLDTVGSAGVMMDPARLRLVREVTEEPASATELARRLGLTRQRVNYHLKELEKAGVVREVGRRRKRNCEERLMRATARAYVVSPGVLGDVSPDPARIEDRRSSAYLVAVASKAIGEVSALGAWAERAGKRPTTVALEAEIAFASAEDRKAFAEELTTLVAQLVREYHAPDAAGATTFRFIVGGYPKFAGHEESALMGGEEEVGA
ncbi:MAG: helix-turn-helix transcriptional regulator [Phycisphaeraceae bacterium]|nr:helix-turn-helix transcriptional regulator [Phycisphaeraceae bacterium]